MTTFLQHSGHSACEVTETQEHSSVQCSFVSLHAERVVRKTGCVRGGDWKRQTLGVSLTNLIRMPTSDLEAD